MRVRICASLLLLITALWAQTSAPTRSPEETTAVAYMRTVVASEKVYKGKHGNYTPTLAALVGTHSFTRRMANPERGEYRVAYKTKKDGYALTLTPKQFSLERRAFYVDETGVVRVEEAKPATAASPPLK